MRLILFAVIFSLTSPVFSEEKERPWNLVCFTKEGLRQVLDHVVNPQQFLQNSLGQTLNRNGITKRGCDYAQIPAGSSAQSSGFHQTDEGFIFPLFLVRFSTTGQRMYAADGIFPAEHWRLETSYCGQYPTEPQGVCIVPKTCDVMDQYLSLSGDFVPRFMTLPADCRRHRIW